MSKARYGQDFSGHGDTDADSHYALPIIRHNRSRLDSIELALSER